MNPFAMKFKWLFFALSSLLLAGCAAQPGNLWLDAPGWSRGHLVGQTASLAPVLPARDEEGNLFFLLVRDETEGPRLHVLSMDSQGQIRWERRIPLDSDSSVKEPRIFWNPGGLSLVWLQGKVLYALNLSPDGRPAGEARPLSGDLIVDHIAAAQSPHGRVEIWFSLDTQQGGIYRLDSQGQPKIVAAQGMNPQVQFDQGGGLHAAWAYNEPGDTEYRFFYAVAPNGEYQPGSENEVYTTRFALTSSFLGPYLGFDGQNVYFFWSELIRTGLSAGTTRARLAMLPRSRQQALSEEPVYFPLSYNLNYSQSGDWQRHGQTALVDEQPTARTSNLTDFFTGPGSQGSTLILALRARLPYLRNKESSQVGIAYFSENGAESYQLLSFTRTYSHLPTVQSDEQGYLYTTWLEASSEEGEAVYFASTAPAFVEAFGRLEAEDYQVMAIETLLGLFSGLFLIFLPLIWIVAPVVLLLVTAPLRRENQTLWAPGVLLSLVLALGAYWLSKLAFFPWITDYVPFSAWIPVIPPEWELPLLVTFPVAIALLAFWTAWKFTFARDRRSALFFTLIYAGVDGLLTVALYGVVFYSAV